MVSITLSVPNRVRELMKRFPEINWSAFVRSSIEKKVEQLSWKEEMLANLKQEDESGYTDLSIELGDKIKEGMLKRYKKEGW